MKCDEPEVLNPHPVLREVTLLLMTERGFYINGFAKYFVKTFKGI